MAIRSEMNKIHRNKTMKTVSLYRQNDGFSRLKKLVQECEELIRSRKVPVKTRRSPLETEDTFIAAVPWGEWRQVLVFRREHGGKSYVRLRTWNKHRTKHVWYPTERFFVVPLAGAKALADAISAAARGEALTY